jgi:hypothetical protein
MRQISNSSAMRRLSRVLLAREHRSPWLELTLIATIAMFLREGSALAEPELALTWSLKEPLAACPDPAWAMTRVASQVGHAPTADVSEGVHAIVEIEKRDAGFLLSLRTRVGSSHGKREIAGGNCLELSEAAILIIALSVAEASEVRAREQTTPPARSPSLETAQEPRSVRAGGNDKAGRLGLLVRPELVVELGLLSTPTLGPGLAFGLAWGRYRAELSGTWLAYGEMDTSGQQIALRLGAARVSGCALFGAGRVRGGPCAGVEFGDVQARNTESGVENNTWWGAASLAARMLVTLGASLALVLDADLVASWGRLRFWRAIEGQGLEQLHASWPVQLRTHLGLEISF